MRLWRGEDSPLATEDLSSGFVPRWFTEDRSFADLFGSSSRYDLDTVGAEVLVIPRAQSVHEGWDWTQSFSEAQIEAFCADRGADLAILVDYEEDIEGRKITSMYLPENSDIIPVRVYRARGEE